MPKVRRTKKRTPEGWELIEPTLEELDKKMREGRLSFNNEKLSVVVLVMVSNRRGHRPTLNCS